MAPIGSLYRTGGPTAMLLVGLLNGLLPCGFVYAALGTAVTAGGVALSTVFMIGFGLGTGPAMLSVSLLGRVAGSTLRSDSGPWSLSGWSWSASCSSCAASA